MWRLSGSFVQISLLLGIAIGSVACDGEDYKPPIPEPRLLIGRTGLETVEGSAMQYSATWISESGSSQVVTNSAEWSSSDVNIADFSDEVAGKLMTKTYGKVEITASYGGKQAKSLLIIRPALASIEISPLSSEVAVEARQAFVATGIYSDKTKEDLTGEVTWETSDKLIAQTVGNGQFEGRHEGNVDVTATLGEITAEASLSVKPATGVEFIVSPADTTLEVIECSTVVIEDEEEKVLVQAFAPSLSLGLIKQISPSGSIDVTEDATWSSSDETLAVVSGDGVVTPVTEGEDGEGNPITLFPEGTVTISAQFDDVTGSVTKKATVKMVKKTLDALENISVTPQDHILFGTEASFTIVATEPESEGGGEFQMTQYVDWYSSDIGVAWFKAPALAATWGPGNTEISAELWCNGQEDPHESANTILLKVTGQPESITIEQATSGPLLLGESRHFTATASFGDNTQDITTDSTWECVDNEGKRSDVAAMDNSAGSEGLATGTAVGTCDVVATFNAVTSDPISLEVQ